MPSSAVQRNACAPEASNAGRTFSRGELLDEVWDFAWEGDTSTVTVHIRRLRAKVEADPAKLVHRNAFNVTAMNFTPEELAAEIRKGVGTMAGLVDYTYRRPSRRARARPGGASAGSR